MAMAGKPKAIDMVLAELPPPSELKKRGGGAAASPMPEKEEGYGDGGGEDSAFNDFAAAAGLKGEDMAGAKAALMDLIRMCASKVMQETQGSGEE